MVHWQRNMQVHRTQLLIFLHTPASSLFDNLPAFYYHKGKSLLEGSECSDRLIKPRGISHWGSPVRAFCRRTHALSDRH
jgi:hypothetical protein